jgi:Tol biopolymer transport system component
MTPERFRQIEELYHAAKDDRAVLAEVDPDLRREVESLLAQDSSKTGMLDQPAWAGAAGLTNIDGTANVLTPGTLLGPYKIEGPLGAGGMGEVFRAVDTRLGRAVAIKITDKQFIARFEREARAISSLNHPHICTLHDVGPNYLVMELCEGETLAARLKRGRLSLEDTLRYGAQIADALAAAHAKGIVHRDLKPGNVMLTKAGAKVLDFGLAKSPEDEALTASRMVMGTPAYMAPEQTVGEEADSRSDLFALGLLLYEMVTGNLPFPGASLGSMLAKAANLKCTLPSKLNPALGTLVLRLLEKDPAQRMQSAAEVRDRLLEIAAPRPAIPRLWIAAGVGLLIAAGAALRWNSNGRDPGPLKYTRLTDFPDSVHSPALSRDGKSLTFVRGPVTFLGGTGQIYVKLLPDGPPVALTSDALGSKMSPVFSPDGARVVYTVSGDGWSSYSVPASGGQPSKFMANAAGLRWTGSGHILFSEIMSGFHMGLVTATESRAMPREVYFSQNSQGMVHFSELSPDGKSVLAVEMVAGVWQPCRLVPFDASSPGKPVGPADALCTAATWSPDGRWLYFSAERNGESHLWRQKFPDGVPEQLTSGPNQEWGVAVNPDGKSLITSVGTRQSSVWLHNEGGDRAVSVEGYAYRPLMSPRGDKIFYLVRRGVRGALWSGELWSFELPTNRNERVLSDFLVENFHISPDSKTVLFDSLDQAGRSKIWIAPLDRSQAPRRLTPDGDAEELRPFLSPSGNVYFLRPLPSGEAALYQMKRDGSERKLLASDVGFLVNVSPDGKWAATWSGHFNTQLVSLSGGGSRALCDCTTGPIFQDSPRVSWSADRTLLFLSVGGSMAGVGTTVIPWRGAEAWPQGGVPGTEPAADAWRARAHRDERLTGVRRDVRLCAADRTEQSL